MDHAPAPRISLLGWAAYVTVAAVGASLALEVPDPFLMVPFVLFGLVLPVRGHWFSRTTGLLLAAIVFETLLVAGLCFFVANFQVAGILFFVLLPLGLVMPPRFRVSAYVFIFGAGVVVLLVRGFATGHPFSVVTFVPGFLAMIAFSETYRRARDSAEESRILLDNLIQTQGRLQDLQSPEPLSPPPVEGTTPRGMTFALSRREAEVLGLLAKGFSNREIAERLFIAEGTVKNRVSDILGKIGVRDRTQAALRGRELGLL